MGERTQLTAGRLIYGCDVSRPTHWPLGEQISVEEIASRLRAAQLEATPAPLIGSEATPAPLGSTKQSFEEYTNHVEGGDYPTHEQMAAKFVRWQRQHSWRRLSGVRRVWATSDLHVEGRQPSPNLLFLRSLRGFDEDALIVAGDVATKLELLRETLALLVGKFRHVFYCVGNHELWHKPFEASADGAFNAGPDSLTRLLVIHEMAESVGAHAAPALVGPALAVVPLQSWYHFGFTSADAPPADFGGRLPDAPADSRLAHMDGACRWPPALAHASTSGSLAPYFASLNDAMLAQAAEHVGGRTLISFSHFLPRPELHRGRVDLGDVEGSFPLGAQLKALAPSVHIFGHTHWAVDVEFDGTRYVQYPLGYAHERVNNAYRVHASEDEPFALLWQRGPGSTPSSDPWSSMLGDVAAQVERHVKMALR